MEAIELDDADLMTLDSGQGYFAGRQHNMMPIMAENYENGKQNNIIISFFRLSCWICFRCHIYVFSYIFSLSNLVLLDIISEMFSTRRQ